MNDSSSFARPAGLIRVCWARSFIMEKFERISSDKPKTIKFDNPEIKTSLRVITILIGIK